MELCRNMLQIILLVNDRLEYRAKPQKWLLVRFSVLGRGYVSTQFVLKPPSAGV
jgi:hypothetical protein